MFRHFSKFSQFSKSVAVFAISVFSLGTVASSIAGSNLPVHAGGCDFISYGNFLYNKNTQTWDGEWSDWQNFSYGNGSYCISGKAMLSCQNGFGAGYLLEGFWSEAEQRWINSASTDPELSWIPSDFMSCDKNGVKPFEKTNFENKVLIFQKQSGSGELIFTSEDDNLAYEIINIDQTAPMKAPAGGWLDVTKPNLRYIVTGKFTPNPELGWVHVEAIRVEKVIDIDIY